MSAFENLLVAIFAAALPLGLSQSPGPDPRKVISLADDVANLEGGAEIDTLEPVPETAFQSAPGASIPRVPLTATTTLSPSFPGAIGGVTDLDLQPSPSPMQQAEAIDEFENSDAEASTDVGYYFDSLSNFISPTDPSGRDNLVLGLRLTAGYDTNVLYSGINQIASLTSTAALTGSFRFGTPRFSIATQFAGGATYYENRPGGNEDTNASVAIISDYQYRPRLRFHFDALVQYLSQPSSQIVGGVFAFSGPYVVTNANFEATFELRPRASLVAGYSLNAIRYEDEVINTSAGFISQTFNLTYNYLIDPRTTLLANYRYNPIAYYEGDAGSDGHVILFGMTRSISPRTEWTLRAGGEFRSLRNPVDSADATSYLGPFVEGEAAYQLGEKSTLEGTLRYGTEPSGVSSVTIRQSFRATVSITRELGPRLSVEGLVSYQNDNYDQPGMVPDFAQTVYSGNLSLNYAFNSSISAVLGYSYFQVASEIEDSSYNRSFISGGIEFSF